MKTNYIGPPYAELGVVSSGSMDVRVLVPRLAAKLDELREKLVQMPNPTMATVARVDQIDTLLGKVEANQHRKFGGVEYWDTHQCDIDLDNLFHALATFGPVGSMFGLMPGTVDDFGYYPKPVD